MKAFPALLIHENYGLGATFRLAAMTFDLVTNGPLLAASSPPPALPATTPHGLTVSKLLENLTRRGPAPLRSNPRDNGALRFRGLRWPEQGAD